MNPLVFNILAIHAQIASENNLKQLVAEDTRREIEKDFDRPLRSAIGSGGCYDDNNDDN